MGKTHRYDKYDSPSARRSKKKGRHPKTVNFKKVPYSEAPFLPSGDKYDEYEVFEQNNFEKFRK